VLDYIEEHGEIANKDARAIFGLKDTAVRSVLNMMLEAIDEKKIRVYRRPPIIRTLQ
jgi:hypothetical protein